MGFGRIFNGAGVEDPKVSLRLVLRQPIIVNNKRLIIHYFENKLHDRMGC